MSPHDATQWFSRTYAEARDAFREAASKHPHVREQGSLAITEQHTIDWAFTGDPSSERVLVYTSGLHGIEGYAGGAVQRKLLSLGEPRAVLWLHALNPWGMAHYRRVNESNVDLNRNFLPEDQPYRADDAAYAALDGLLNPKGPPGFDLFLLRAGVSLARHGMSALRNAVARGQYSFAKGLFYGGSGPEATTRAVLSFVPERLRSAKRVAHIDLHTARGPRGDYVAFLENAGGDERERARPVFEHRLRAWEAGSADGYDMRGGMLPELIRRAKPHGTRYDAITLEFGTSTDLAILRALREENQRHFYGENSSHSSPTPAMREAFCPEDPAWRASVLGHATDIHERATRLLASG